jgi:cell division septum initiation protein DivIVA
MVRTQIQLTDEQAESLRRRARRENVSMAELVRRAIDAFTRTGPPSGREVRNRAMAAAGRFASGVRDTSRRHDEALAKAFGPQ